jgi:hypothetical protein
MRIAASPELQQAVEEVRQANLDLAKSQLIDSIKARERWAICFYLKYQGKHRGWVERSELTGPNGTSILGLTIEQFDAIVRGTEPKGKKRIGKAAEENRIPSTTQIG